MASSVNINWYTSVNARGKHELANQQVHKR